jgi:hypothetical protein
MLAASLLHDVIENYKPLWYDKNSIHNRARARDQAEDKIINAFPDKEFAKKVLGLVRELTDDLEYKNSFGNEITRKEWQVAHIKNVSVLARVIKICDQTANLISNIEEVPNWNYDRLTAYKDKSDAVVAAAQENIPESEKRHLSPVFATRFYEMISVYTQSLLDDIKRDNKPIPSPHQMASINIDGIHSEIRKEIERNVQRFLQEFSRHRTTEIRAI